MPIIVRFSCKKLDFSFREYNGMVFNIFPIVFIVPIVAIILFYCQIQLQSPFSEPFSHIKRKIAHT